MNLLLAFLPSLALLISVATLASAQESDGTCEQVVFFNDVDHEEDMVFGWTSGYYDGRAIGGDRQGFDARHFRSHRWGSEFGFEIEGEFLADRQYEVTLGFAEVYDGNCAVGRRKFDVHVNGEIFVEQLDVFDRVGCGNALVLNKKFYSKEGKFVIKFSKGLAGANNAMVSLTQISECRKAGNACPCWDELDVSEIYAFGKVYRGTYGSPQPTGLSYVYLRTLEGPEEFQRKEFYKLTEEYDGSLTCNDERTKISVEDFSQCKKQLFDAATQFLDKSYSNHTMSSCPYRDSDEVTTFSVNYDYYLDYPGWKSCTATNYNGRYNPAAGIYVRGGFRSYLYLAWNEYGYSGSYDITQSPENLEKNQCQKDSVDLCMKEAIAYYEKY